MLFLAQCAIALRLGLYEVVVVACAATLLALLYAEGWIWPLKAAAIMIPVTLLIG